MVERIITGYTYVCADKKITITQTEFVDTRIEEVKSIFNASTGDWLYNTDVGRHGVKRSNWNIFHPIDNISNGVITYTAPNPSNATDNDKLIILIRSNSIALDGGTP